MLSKYDFEIDFDNESLSWRDWNGPIKIQSMVHLIILP